jgi:hypothetical protein
MKHSTGKALGILLLCFFVGSSFLAVVSSNVSAEGKDWTHGEEEWLTPQKNRLYFYGSDTSDTNLSLFNPFPTDPVGNLRVGGSATPMTVFDSIQSPPLIEAIDAEVNISGFIHATASDVPLVTCAIQGRATQIFLDVKAGGEVVYSSESESIIIREGSMSRAHNFTFDRTQIHLNLSVGDVIEATLSIMHDCTVPIDLWWNGIVHDGGIILEGDVLKPEARVLYDDLGFAHVDFVALGPWGMEGYRSITVEVWGPLDSDDGRPMDRESILAIFTDPQDIRSVEESRTAYTYVTPKLGKGHYLIQFCMETNDGYYTTKIGECHFKGWLHIVDNEVEEDGFNAIYWLAPTAFLSVLLWLGWNVKQSIILPAPLMVLMLVMSLLLIPLTSQMPNLGESDERIESDWPVPQFVLNTAGNNSSAMSLDSLLMDKEATLIAVSIVGSPNAYSHLSVLEMVQDKLSERMSVAMLITGDDVAPFELETLNEKVDGKWAVMIDEHDGGVAANLPTGMADGLILIDSSGHVAWWSEGSTTLEDVEVALDDISEGSGSGPMMLIALLWTAFFPLILISLPTSDWQRPEEPLPPGANWGGTILTAGFGFTVFALPVAILGMTGLSGEAWYLVQLGIAGYLIYQAVATMVWGCSPEVKLLGNQLYGFSPRIYRLWKPKEEFLLEFQLGLWVGLISWMTSPMLIPQIISTPLMTSGYGISMGLLMLVGCIITSGTVVLVARMISSMAGRVSVLFGKHGRADLIKVYGVIMLPLSLWMMMSVFLDAQNIGFF